MPFPILQHISIIVRKQEPKSFVLRSLQVWRGMKGIAAGPLRRQTNTFEVAGSDVVQVLAHESATTQRF